MVGVVIILLYAGMIIIVSCSSKMLHYVVKGYVMIVVHV
jgi:hypothetical protein